MWKTASSKVFSNTFVLFVHRKFFESPVLLVLALLLNITKCSSQLSVYVVGKFSNPDFIRLLQIKLCTEFRLRRSQWHYANNIYLSGNSPKKLTLGNYKWQEVV